MSSSSFSSQLSSYVSSIRDEYEKDLKLYIRHHNNKLNWYLHTICIPAEATFFLVTIGVVLYPIFDYGYSRALLMMFSCIVALYYLLLARYHSIPSAVAIILMGYLATSLITFKGIWLYAVVIEIIAWSLQVFVGHYFLNKNNPSMTQELSIRSMISSVLLCWDNSDNDYIVKENDS